ncbi:MAG: gamma-glutamyltransferase family protein [Acidimicrobiia bacterium]
MARRYRFPRAAVATPHYLASAAGAATLARGGNAVDAALAANLALGVVAPYLCGYGGDVFAIVWDGELHGYLGSGRSAAAASRDDVQARHGHMPVFGADSVTTPGGPAGWFALLERFGTRDFGELATEAVRLARDGFEVTPAGAIPFEESRQMYRSFEAWMQVYGTVDVGSVLRQPALARTIEALAADGPDAYYRGAIAHAIAGAIADGGGSLAVTDLASHTGEWAAPLRAPYRDVEIAELPPPTQGASTLEALRILDGFDDLGRRDPVAREHLRIEAFKAAMADRDQWITDPDAMPVAASTLYSDGWVAARRAAIDPDRAGTPDAALAQPGGTAYLCAADADGLMVSLIQSNFVHFGSGVHVPEWGINLNNRGFSFSLDPARPNVLAPGKRPMHTLIPAMGLRDGEPWLVFGSMGGDAQAAVHVQVFGHVIDEGADPADAISEPRWRADVGTWTVRAETRMPDAVVAGLRALGHDVRTTSGYDSGMGHAHAIWRTAGGYGVTSDPRSEGSALGL